MRVFAGPVVLVAKALRGNLAMAIGRFSLAPFPGHRICEDEGARLHKLIANRRPDVSNGRSRR